MLSGVWSCSACTAGTLQTRCIGWRSFLREGKKEVALLCKEYDLTAELILRVYAESNDLPVIALPSESVSFWSKMGAGMQFDLYLD